MRIFCQGNWFETWIDHQRRFLVVQNGQPHCRLARQKRAPARIAQCQNDSSVAIHERVVNDRDGKRLIRLARFKRECARLGKVIGRDLGRALGGCGVIDRKRNIGGSSATHHDARRASVFVHSVFRAGELHSAGRVGNGQNRRRLRAQSGVYRIAEGQVQRLGAFSRRLFE